MNIRMTSDEARHHVLAQHLVVGAAQVYHFIDLELAGEIASEYMRRYEAKRQLSIANVLTPFQRAWLTREEEALNSSPADPYSACPPYPGQEAA